MERFKKRHFASIILLFLFSFSFQNCGKGFEPKDLTENNSLSSIESISTCTFNAQTIDNGVSVPAYLTSTVPPGQLCLYEDRLCTNGVLGGSYAFGSCVVSAPKLKKITAGHSHACALVDDKVKCWGTILSGHDILAAGKRSLGTPQFPETVFSEGISDIATKEFGLECHISNGSVICTGGVYTGAFDGSFTTRVLANSGATSVQVGNFGVCATVNQALQCWDRIYEFSTRAPTPYIFLNDSIISDYALSSQRICAVVNNGAVKCGIRSSNQTFIQSAAKKISIDQLGNACAVVGSDLQCWAYSSSEFYFKPDGSQASNLTPEVVMTQVKDVSMATNGVAKGICVVKEDTSVACWGQSGNLSLVPYTVYLQTGAATVNIMAGAGTTDSITVEMMDGTVMASVPRSSPPLTFIRVNLE